MIHENDKNYIITEVESILSKRESVFPYKESIKEKVEDSGNFESFFQKMLKLSNLFDNYALSTTTKNYERLYKQVQVCGLSKSWINNVIRKAGIEVLSEDNENNKEDIQEPIVIHQPELKPVMTILDEKTVKYKYCTRCGKTITIDSKYCPYCGNAQKMKECWVCKRKIPFGAVYCPYCNANNNPKR